MKCTKVKGHCRKGLRNSRSKRCRDSSGKEGVKIRSYHRPKLCHVKAGPCSYVALPQRGNTCYLVSFMNVVQKVNWLRMRMHPTVRKYVADVWNSERRGAELCITVPKMLVSAYARLDPRLNRITDVDGGDDTTLLRALLEVSAIPYAYHYDYYDRFFEKPPAHRALYFTTRLTLLKLSMKPGAQPRPKMFLSVLKNLLIDEGIPVSFGFLNVPDHTMSFTVCRKPTTHIVTCSQGKCYVVNHDANYTNSIVEECTIVVYRPHRPDSSA